MIAVELNPLEAGGLGADSNYRVRQLHAGEYKESQEHIGGDLVSLMAKSDKQELTMFWVHGNRVLTVAITSSDARDNLDAFMATIKKSVKWR
jgi:hypothetical protein